MRSVVALYDRFEDAQQAVRTLRDSNFDQNDINIIARDANGEYSRSLGNKDLTGAGAGGGAASGAGVGAVLGGLGGLLVGLGALAIPGIGPVIAAGPILTTLGGAGLGAVAGGVIGALVDLGIPNEHAQYYAEGVRRGGTLVIVRTSDERAETARQILNRFNPVDLENRARAWKEGHWTGFDESGQPLGAGQMEFNRSAASMPVTGADTEAHRATPPEEQPGRQAGEDLGSTHPGEESHDWSQPRDQASSHPGAGAPPGSGSGDIPVTGGPARRDDNLSDAFGGDERTGDEIYGQAGAPSEPRDIPVTGGTLDVESVEEVDIFPVDAQDWLTYDQDFRADYQARFGNQGYGYEHYQPAYRFGYYLARSPQYREEDWDMLEPQARKDWQRSGVSGAWEEVKDAVHHAWQRVKRI